MTRLVLALVGTLAVLSALGGCDRTLPCSTSSDCPGEQFCRGTFCTAYPAGDFCDFGAQCITDRCIDGRCTGELGVLCLDITARNSCPIDGQCSERPGRLISPVCMLRCDRSTDWICSDGTLCLQDSDDETVDVCHLGGGTQLGEVCDLDFHCDAGMVCVDARCRFGCDTTGPDCPDGTVCEPIDHPSGRAGVCAF